jgi:pseudouridine synthase
MAAERLQKLLARAGVASRRHAEEVIRAGRVTVNGQVVAEMGARADPAVDRIAVDGRDLTLDETSVAHVYYALNKPAGYVCTTRDPAGRPSVLDLLPPHPALITVGRLDLDSAGLLLVTNDGEWAQRISHPRYGVAKEYRAIVRGVPSFAALRRLREGVAIPDGTTAPAEVRLLHNRIEEGTSELAVVLHEGHKRQVRFMLAAVGHPVVHLTRVRVGPVQLGDLQPGTYRSLTEEEVGLLGAGG